MVLSSCSLVARVDDGVRGAADILARADFEMVRAELRRRARGGSVWELRVLSREPFQPIDFGVLGVRREGTRLDRLDLIGPDGVIQLRDVVMVGDSIHPKLVVKRLTVAGFGDEPRVSDIDGGVRLDAEGVSASFREARVERSSSRLLTVTWDGRA